MSSLAIYISVNVNVIIIIMTIISNVIIIVISIPIIIVKSLFFLQKETKIEQLKAKGKKIFIINTSPKLRKIEKGKVRKES